MRLIDITQLIPDAVIDLRYTSDRNVLGHPIEGAQVIPQLDQKVAEALAIAADLFRKQQLKLKVWDAYRSNQVQAALQAIEPDEKYVRKESNHCLGLAIDVTLINDAGTELDMGTDHDDFSPKAYVNTQDLTPLQLQNRQLLISIMQQAGFTVWPYEWWHFDYTVTANSVAI